MSRFTPHQVALASRRLQERIKREQAERDAVAPVDLDAMQAIATAAVRQHIEDSALMHALECAVAFDELRQASTNRLLAIGLAHRYRHRPGAAVAAGGVL